MEIASTDDFGRALAQAADLTAAGKGAEAVSFVDGCTGSAGLLLQLRAAAYSGVRDDRETLLKAAALMRELNPEASLDVSFQLAAVLQSVAELTAREDDPIAVIEKDHLLLREARLRYEQVAESADADSHMRVIAWVNLGNSYDFMGRDVEALRCYDSALRLDPSFGMALGNQAQALLGIAPFMGGHESHVVEDAAFALDRAFEDEARVLAVGGDSALRIFRDLRNRINGEEPQKHDPHGGAKFSDPHLQWAHEKKLLLHISPDCLTDQSEAVDPLHLGKMTVGIDEESQLRLKRLRDAFNAIKQDFISARYTLWLASDPSSPIREQTDAISKRGYYADTLSYARWGVRTGIALQALTAATNALDKIAGVTHLYFNTGRAPKKVYFNGMWHQKPAKKESLVMEAEFAAQMHPQVNRGLLALCDLSLDVSGSGDPTALKQLIARRQAATHRFLVAHDLPMYEQDETELLLRIDWPDLVDGAVRQLSFTRAALVYLARGIAAREEARPDSGFIPPLPSFAVEEFDGEP
jgi:LA2681-like HEPN/Tetratricopeptide repeat